jgi:hypothetical protein
MYIYIVGVCVCRSLARTLSPPLSLSPTPDHQGAEGRGGHQHRSGGRSPDRPRMPNLSPPPVCVSVCVSVCVCVCVCGLASKEARTWKEQARAWSKHTVSSSKHFDPAKKKRIWVQVWGCIPPLNASRSGLTTNLAMYIYVNVHMYTYIYIYV